MKLAIVAWAHLASTFPYIKRLLILGFNIDLYLIASKNIQIEGFNFNKIILTKGITKIDENIAPDVFSYISNKNFNFYAVRVFRTYDFIPVLRRIGNKLKNKYYEGIINGINSKKYDRIHLVGRYNCSDMIYFINGLQKPLSIALHEVCNHLHKDFTKPTQLLRLISVKDIPIIVHSQNVYNDLLSYRIFNTQNITCINFGLFETFTTIKEENKLDLPEHYILCYGYINDYKGIDVLYEAFCEKKKELTQQKFVIAGYGKVKALNDIYKESSFVCINRYLKNSEIVELIKRSDCVVCPYRSVSQSGIPQTVFNFSKPIIASNLNAFTDLIVDDSNGFLFPVGNAEELGACIVKMFKDNKYLTLQNKVLETWAAKEQYNWNYIAKQYLKLWNN